MAQSDFSHLTDAELKEMISLEQRNLLIKNAKNKMLDYCHLMMPDVSDPNDVTKTEYDPAGHAKMLCDIVERFESGKSKRVAVSIPPQHGKTIHLSQLGLSWIWGRNPRKNIVVVTYNQTRADELGHEFRQFVKDRPTFRQVFPEVEFMVDAKSKSFMQNKKGGKIFFIGVGGTITGRTADYIIIDDPFKGDDDEFTPAHLEKIWSWFFKIAYSRASNRTKICVIHCMTGDTPVLMSDGVEKPLRDVRSGDMIASYKDGKIVSSKVLNWKNQGRDCLFTIKMKSGISVRANARHPFLVSENGEEKWLRTDQIRKGMFIRRVIGESTTVNNALSKIATNQPDVKDCVIHTTVKNDGQMVTDHLHTTQKVEENNICDIGMESKSKITNECLTNKKGYVQSVDSLHQNKKVHDIKVENYSLTTVTTQVKSEDCSVTGAILLLDTEKQKQFYGQQLDTLQVVDDEVSEVICDGEEDVFDIQVEDTENFIANGLVSHNTRWNEDDLIGRLCDPTHPERNKRFRGIASDWEFMNIPGVIYDERLANALSLKLSVPKNPRVIEMFGEKPSTALWPKEKSLEFFAQWKRGDPRSFSALVMGSPAPEDGYYFTNDMIVEYHSHSDLPQNLRKYGASDHAVSEKQRRDKTVLGCVGIDEDDNIWIMPDIVWDQMETDRTVEELLSQFKIHRPHCWWMESELISKSFGPFLRKRMVEDRVYTLIDPQTPSKDKMVRARSIQGRMSMKKVFFPAFAPWFQDAKNQLLKFGSGGANDDFVDWLAWIGLGLTKEIAAQSYRPPKSNIPKTGTVAWVIHASEQRKAQERNSSKGW